MLDLVEALKSEMKLEVVRPLIEDIIAKSQAIINLFAH
jgi:hypothetical protein